MLTIAAAAWEAELLPALGGAIGALRYAGQDVLRPTPDGATDPLDSACFPLVPYANRIAGGRFAFDGRDDHAAAQFRRASAQPARAWLAARVGSGSRRASDRARLRHRHDGGGGLAVALSCRAVVRARRDGLSVALSLANESRAPMPAGPRPASLFPRLAADGAALRCRARLACAIRRSLPTHDADADHFGDWRGGAVIAGTDLVDNAYERWDGNASLDQGDRTIRLVAEGARDLHLCIPAGGSFCCVEPVTHLPDAFNRPGGLFDVLPAGGSMTLTMRISVETGGRSSEITSG